MQSLDIWMVFGWDTKSHYVQLCILLSCIPCALRPKKRNRPCITIAYWGGRLQVQTPSERLTVTNWLPLPKHIQFRNPTLIRNSAVVVVSSYHNQFSSLPGRSTLRSAATVLLVVPIVRSATAHFICLIALVGPPEASSIAGTIFLSNYAINSSPFLSPFFGHALSCLLYIGL